ncbi:MAG: hypothetical protein DSY33_00695 [Archaeoglobus sp.]|jgi:hypothetical protein|nr:MAG: hypothetical protein DSY33_00695 [Archaeoglobus sp.]
MRKIDRDIDKIKNIRRAGANIPVNAGKEGSKAQKMSLRAFTTGIALATLKAKTIVDSEAIKVKKEIYEKNEIMQNLPITTFDFSEVEVELKFVVEDVEGEDVLINTDPETIAKLQNSLSTMRLKLISKPLLEYTLSGGGKVIK